MAKDPRRVTDPYPLFTAVVKRLGAPAPVREFQFNPERKYRFDYCWPELMLAVEVNGGIWRRSGKGAHTGGAAVKRDMQKHNLAVLGGWAVLSYLPEQLTSVAATEVVDFIKHKQSHQRPLGSGLQPIEGEGNELRVHANVHR